MAGVPVVADLAMAVKADADLEVGVTTDVHQTASFTIGAQYAHGSFSPVCTKSFSAGCDPPTIYGTAAVKAAIGPQLSTTICDVAGPYAGVDGYGAFEADSTATPWWTLHGGLEGSVGFEMKILSHTLADWSYTHDFYDHVFAQAPSGSNAAPSADTNANSNANRHTDAHS